MTLNKLPSAGKRKTAARGTKIGVRVREDQFFPRSCKPRNVSVVGLLPLEKKKGRLAMMWKPWVVIIEAGRVFLPSHCTNERTNEQAVGGRITEGGTRERREADEEERCKSPNMTQIWPAQQQQPSPGLIEDLQASSFRGCSPSRKTLAVCNKTAGGIEEEEDENNKEMLTSSWLDINSLSLGPPSPPFSRDPVPRSENTFLLSLCVHPSAMHRPCCGSERGHLLYPLSLF